METGEIVAIVVVVVVLLLGSIFLCFRCWKAVAEVVEDDQKPKRQTFMGSVRDGLRRSFRSSVHRMSNIRNSFRRSGGRGGSKSRGNVSAADAAIAAGRRPPTVATIQGLGAETSQIHPSYLKQTIRNENASNVPRGMAAPVNTTRCNTYDDPTAGFGGSIKHAPSVPEGLGGTPEGEVISYPNPLYNRDPERGTAKASGIHKVKSKMSGYKEMEEDHSPTHRSRQDGGHSRQDDGYGYDQPHSGYTNANYKSDSPQHRATPGEPAQRYDLPFDETSGQGHGKVQGHAQGQSAPGGVQKAVYDLHQESVSFPDAEARNTNAESTYI